MQADITVGAKSDRDFTYSVTPPTGAYILAQIPIPYANAIGCTVGRNYDKNYTARIWNSNSSSVNVSVAFLILYLL